MNAVSLRLPEPMAARLAALAQQTGRSKTYYMLQAIARHLDKLEDIYLAEQRLVEHRASGDKTISLAQLMHEYAADSDVQS
jgi:RHH-type rel operon transcriptional repressor/antitoxin RelB